LVSLVWVHGIVGFVSFNETSKKNYLTE
jgi:hypothetical protein